VEAYVRFIVTGNKFTIKALLCSTLYLCMVDSDVSLADTHNAMWCDGRRHDITLFVHCPSLHLHAVGFRRIAAFSRVLENLPGKKGLLMTQNTNTE